MWGTPISALLNSPTVTIPKIPLIDRTLRKYARHIGLSRGYSAHSMRATFITTALDNGASLEDVQSAAGHADPSTTKLYDRRGYNPEKSASSNSANTSFTLARR
jgi:integrase